MINRCIGCYYHDSKENVCIHGSPIFLDDTCTDYQDNEFVKQIRADMLNEFTRYLANNSELGNVAYLYKASYLSEQLKEQKNE